MKTFRVSVVISAMLCICEIPCDEIQTITPTKPSLDNSESQLNLMSSKINELPPTVMVVLLVRNKAHILPHFLALFERLEYPKDRIRLYIRSDHNEDDTLFIMEKWIKKWEAKRVMGYRDTYHFIDAELVPSPPERFTDESSPIGTTTMRFHHVMELKEGGLNKARSVWADVVWFLDCDVFIANPNTLKIMAQKSNLTVYAPLLSSVGKYSNFWAGMGEDYYYRRTKDYEPILHRENTSCFSVPLVHSSIFVNLNLKDSQNLTF